MGARLRRARRAALEGAGGDTPVPPIILPDGARIVEDGGGRDVEDGGFRIAPPPANLIFVDGNNWVWVDGNNAISVSGSILYRDKILSYSPIAYWPLNETTGLTADNAEGTAARDGTYTGVTLNSTPGPDAQPAPLWDGLNDYCDIYSANLSGVFNWSEGSLVVWAKVSAVGVWTDAASRNTVRIFSSAVNDRLELYKLGSDNRLQYGHRLGGVAKGIAKTGVSETGWMHLGLTWSKAADEVKAYYNGAQTGATQTGLGVASGDPLHADATLIGASSTAPLQVWDGYLAHVAVFDTVFTPAQIADLAVV